MIYVDFSVADSTKMSNEEDEQIKVNESEQKEADKCQRNSESEQLVDDNAPKKRTSSRLAMKAASTASSAESKRRKIDLSIVKKEKFDEIDYSNGYWTPRQKRRLLVAIKKCGSRNVQEIKESSKCGKSSLAIVAMINKLKKKNDELNSVKVEVSQLDDFTSSFYNKKKKSESKRKSFAMLKDNPVDKWMEVMGQKGKVDASANVLMMSIDAIIKKEKHPKKGKVDYAAIYETFASLMKGDIPKPMNKATRTRFMEMVNNFQDIVNKMEPKFEDEMKMLSSFRLMDLSKSKNVLTRTVNPLNLPAKFFSKEKLM